MHVGAPVCWAKALGILEEKEAPVSNQSQTRAFENGFDISDVGAL